MAPAERTAAFTDQLIELGFWYLCSLTDPPPQAESDESAEPAMFTPQSLWAESEKQALTGTANATVEDLVEQLTPILQRQVPHGPSPRHIVEQALVTRARKTTANGTPQAPSGAAIDAARHQLLVEWGCPSSKGALLWPPAARTIAVRLGDGTWNQAMVTLGMKVSARGRRRGDTSFSDDDFRWALAAFVWQCEVEGRKATYGGYAEWARAERKAGDMVPAASTIRQRFGKWATALAYVERAE